MMIIDRKIGKHTTFSLQYQKQPSEVFCKKVVLKIFAKFTKACNFIKKETLGQMLSSEFCEISKNTFLENTFGRLLPQYIQLPIRHVLIRIKQRKHQNNV